MSILYGMKKRVEYETNNAKKRSCYKMVKQNTKLGCAGLISMQACCMLAVVVVIAGVVVPAQARFFIHKKSEEPQSTLMAFPRVGRQSTLMAFPRVGRSISDSEYSMFDDQNEEGHDSNRIMASDPGSLEVTQPQFGKRTRLNTRSSKGSMMAFPRVGKRAHKRPHTNNITKLLASKDIDYGQEQWSNDQGFTEAVRNNDLYGFLHSMLREIAKSQQQNKVNDFGEY